MIRGGASEESNASLYLTVHGAGTDESPQVYKRLEDVLGHDAISLQIEHTFIPIGVCMAGDNEFDPYRD